MDDPIHCNQRSQRLRVVLFDFLSIYKRHLHVLIHAFAIITLQNLKKSYCLILEILRSYCYFNASFFTASVPLMLTADGVESRRRKRASQQNKECNLAFILICTVSTFFICHIPRYDDDEGTGQTTKIFVDSWQSTPETCCAHFLFHFRVVISQLFFKGKGVACMLLER